METFCKLIRAQTYMNYAVVLPIGKSAADMKGKPLILSLHGTGTYGTDPRKVLESSAYTAFYKYGIDAILVLPHSESTPFSQRTAELMAIIDRVADEYGADRERISILGGSMGGYATWDMILQFPHTFSAACVMCGGGQAFRAASAPVTTPLKIYHGDSDGAVQPYHAKEMHAAVLAGNKDADCELIVCENTAHDCWTRAHLEDNILAWLVSKKRTTFNVYACGPKEGGGIAHYVLRGGKLTQLEYTPDEGCSYLVYKHGRIYGTFNDREGSVASYELYAGMLAARSPKVRSYGKSACHLYVNDSHDIYLVNYSSGSVVKTSIERNDVKIVTHQGDGPNKPRQDMAHTHQLCLTPDGKYLTCCDLGTDTIYVYDFNLVEYSRVQAPAGHGPRHLLFSDDGKYAYCLNELLNTVTVYAYDAGVLTRLETYDMLPFGFDGFTKASAIKKYGDDLYTTNRGHDSITRFKMRGAVLEYVDNVKVHGESPRDISISPDGKTLISANESGTLTVFDRAEDGTLTFTGEEHTLPGALCVLFV